MRMRGEQCQVDQTDIGLAEQAGRHAVARHIHRLKAGLLHHARTVGIVNARRHNHAALGQTLAQLLPYRQIRHLFHRIFPVL